MQAVKATSTVTSVRREGISMQRATTTVSNVNQGCMQRKLGRLMSLLVLNAPLADIKGAPVRAFASLALLAQSAIVQTTLARVSYVLQACSRTSTMKYRAVFVSRVSSKSPSARHSATFARQDISTPTRGNTRAVLATVAASLVAHRPLA